jgi:hypothetical protein
MGFLRRLLGGPETPRATTAAEPAAVEDEERSRELEILREDQARFDDLAQRQLRYADYAWQPPAQGGDRRADDADAEASEGTGG